MTIERTNLLLSPKHLGEKMCLPILLAVARVTFWEVILTPLHEQRHAWMSLMIRPCRRELSIRRFWKILIPRLPHPLNRGAKDSLNTEWDKEFLPLNCLAQTKVLERSIDPLAIPLHSRIEDQTFLEKVQERKRWEWDHSLWSKGADGINLQSPWYKSIFGTQSTQHRQSLYESPPWSDA